MTKMSILLQYRRVFSTTPNMRLACLILIAFLAAYGTWTIVSAWANCVPVEKFWNPDTPGFCLDKEALWFSNSAVHILTDLLILIYPMPVLQSLQLPKKQKLALMGVFALGGFVMITSILRLKSLLVISKSTDPTYDNVGAATWSAVECNVAIICACLPGTRAFFTKLFPHVFSNRSGAYKSKGSKFTHPSRTHRSTNLNTYTTTQIQASVVGGHRESGYDLDDFSHSDSSRAGSMKESGSKEGHAGIKVTTFMTQESTSNTIADGHHYKEMDGDSTRDLVHKQSADSF
ncbi:hypothetical protein N7474_002800 [Penicillium riverlandense]|uniref:uncharacterized protein n=1 Tax=Penicillium riverlandense TaxID=1903569 RepID=UPI0025485E60|nr:uncharacterized protein N7474_002800 [Penicillium riverlandense]KAJ5825662.1 hypothetical protein N7474_002800 [Penicillium riverlandense]